jgi:two-component system, sensor histidine kinase
VTANSRFPPAALTGAEMRRVLIVEDNPDGRESLRLFLSLAGYHVETAEDGPGGVHQALAWKPHAALVDIGLPGFDGYQVARQVRTALGRRVLLIALTAYTGEEDRQRAREAGFDIFLVKPAEPEHILGCLDQRSAGHLLAVGR